MNQIARERKKILNFYDVIQAFTVSLCYLASRKALGAGMRLTLEHNTDNGPLMLDPATVKDVTGFIDDPSDAIIPAETSLYRVAHKLRYDRTSGSYVPNAPETAFQSPWWTTNYFFNQAVWASDDPELSNAARQAFAIHPAWRSDCSNYASVITRTDLSVWYGLGAAVTDKDPSNGSIVRMPGSTDVLQIYIPGFCTNHLRWAMRAQVIAFEKSLGNARGFQGNLPRGLRE